MSIELRYHQGWPSNETAPVQDDGLSVGDVLMFLVFVSGWNGEDSRYEWGRVVHITEKTVVVRAHNSENGKCYRLARSRWSRFRAQRFLPLV